MQFFRNHINPLLVLLALAVTGGCSLDNYAPATPMHPPLGLTLGSETNAIIVTFLGRNGSTSEPDFAGYNVFMASDSNTVAARAAADVYTNDSAGMPSFRDSPYDEVRSYTHVLRHDPAGNALATGSTWYITVSAWDSYYKQNSRLGEILAVQVNN